MFFLQAFDGIGIMSDGFCKGGREPFLRRAPLQAFASVAF